MNSELVELRIRTSPQLAQRIENSVGESPDSKILARKIIPVSWEARDKEAEWGEELIQLLSKVNSLEDSLQLEPVQKNLQTLLNQINKWFGEHRWLFAEIDEIPMSSGFKEFLIRTFKVSVQAYQETFPSPKTPYTAHKDKKIYFRLDGAMRPRDIRVIIDFYGLDNTDGLGKSLEEIAAVDYISIPQAKSSVKEAFEQICWKIRRLMGQAETEARKNIFSNLQSTS